MLLAAFAVFPSASQTVQAGFESRAGQALLIEADTGTVLYAKNEAQPIASASLAKLMTMELVFAALKAGELSADTEFPVSEHAWRTGGAPSRTATMFAALKSRIRVEDLVKGVTVQMANDACIILAEGMEGSEEKFAERMNARAKALGLKETVFANATGLPNPLNKTSARDMALLARHIVSSYPDPYRLYALSEFEWNKILQRNRNPLLAMDIGADGLLTGYAEESGYAIVASATRDGVRLFLVMSGLASDKERTEEAARVLNWGLTSFERKRVFEAGEVIGAASVYGGAASSIDLIAKAPVEIFVPIANPERLSARIVYRWPLSAPVAAGDQAGVLRIFSGERLLREVPLQTAAAVEPGSLRRKATDALLELLFFWL
ncbi:D-alanyl-D-alanine carboxypeptidase [Rhizobium sp. CG5]|uniref:D-alanyl-D-alanine carboxypeptidase family protein n=1 Tax=Rhizobium sp. CG5 TaxID=2726076 RepID=UPI0020335630|nr:D-alanyl-D-alanine carboxypeptidase family protein [Rhizobium sp. CG5]MCM2474715.1 D-alanyl-D-alanine carboxypeptidase [Rhizobium sp. CG5]